MSDLTGMAGTFGVVQELSRLHRHTDHWKGKREKEDKKLIVGTQRKLKTERKTGQHPQKERHTVGGKQIPEILGKGRRWHTDTYKGIRKKQGYEHPWETQ